MPDVYAQLAAVAAEVSRLAAGVDPAEGDAPTPCAGFDVAGLSAHLLQELLLHGWDLAVATGRVPRFGEDAADTVLRWLDADDDRLRQDGWYADPVETASASVLARAVARSGRDPDWAAPRRDPKGP